MLAVSANEDGLIRSGTTVMHAEAWHMVSSSGSALGVLNESSFTYLKGV